MGSQPQSTRGQQVFINIYTVSNSVQNDSVAILEDEGGEGGLKCVNTPAILPLSFDQFSTRLRLMYTI